LTINKSAPLYMRVRRQGNTWTQSYSYDGQAWTVAGSFQHAMAVTSVGVHSSNHTPYPTHTASVDYFWNRALSNSDDTVAGNM
jgi:hypothetical protein